MSAVSFKHTNRPIVTSIKQNYEKGNTFSEGFLSSVYDRKYMDDEDVKDIVSDYADKIPKKDIDYFTRKKIALTDFDTPEVIETRLDCLNAKPVTVNDDEYKENHEKIVREHFSQIDNTPVENKMVIMTGFPASGKSYLIEQEYKDRYYVADIDEVKKMFPSFEESGKRLNTLHSVSRDILQKELIPYAQKEGKNIVVPTTGLSEYIERLSKPAKENGYNVEIVHTTTSHENAMRAVVKRFEREGRFIDPVFVAMRAPYLDSQLEDFTNSNLVDKITVIQSYLNAESVA